MSEIALLSDDELVERVHALRKMERTALASLLRHLIEMERRNLAVKRGRPSLYEYCRTVLGYGEGAAYKRIYACRIGRDFPIAIDMIESGALHLAAVNIVGPVLTAQNFEKILAAAVGKTKRELQFLAAAEAPKADVPDSIVSAQDPRTDMFALGSGDGIASSSPWSRMAGLDAIEPLSAARVRFTFTGGKQLLDLVDRAKEILRHKFPEGRLEQIFSGALDALLDKKDPDRRLRRLEETGRQAPDPAECDPLSRRVPQGVRDVVWRRDGGRCTHVDPATGERCPERGGLEFDHVVPHALGGPSNNPKNIRLLCRAHNRLAAIRLFGEAATRHWARE